MKNERFIPSVGVPNWDIETLSKSERSEIRNRLVASITHDEDEYRAVLAYLHMKYPDLMDVEPGDGRLFQWKYHEFDHKVNAYDTVGRVKFDMYGLIYYDPEMDMEPVAVGGSYLREAGAIRDPYTHLPIEGQILNPHTTTIRCGHGYVLFIDPNYRRMGLARDQWITEAQLYRDSGIHYQRENQTYAALKVTLSMFKDRSKCHILSGRKLENIHDGMNTKIIMDYFDEELVSAFNNLPERLRDFRQEPFWHFIERENLSFEGLISPWKNLRKRDGKSYDSKIDFHFSVDRNLYEAFKDACYADGTNVKDAITRYMAKVTGKSIQS